MLQMSGFRHPGTRCLILSFSDLDWSFMPKRADIRTMRNDFKLVWADFKPNRAYFILERGDPKTGKGHLRFESLFLDLRALISSQGGLILSLRELYLGFRG